MRLGQPRAVASPAAAAPLPPPRPPPPRRRRPRRTVGVHRSSATRPGRDDRADARGGAINESQVEEARADETRSGNRRAPTRARWRRPAKNIEGNQGVLAGVVTTLEAQLGAAHKEKDGAMSAQR